MEFQTTLCKDGRLTAIQLPFNAKEVFNRPKGKIFVTGSINGIPYRNKLLSKENQTQVMTVDQQLQKALGYTGLDMPVTVIMECENESDRVNMQDISVAVQASGIDTITTILSRTSIRKFTNAEVELEKIETIIYAGQCAPSAKDKRPIHFIVIKDKQMLDDLSSANPNARFLSQTPCCIVVCGDGNIEGDYKFLVEDCAAATQNMLLAIHSMGLGGVWCGVIRGKEWSKQISDILKLPIKIEPVSVVAFGYPMEKNDPKNRYDKSHIHLQCW